MAVKKAPQAQTTGSIGPVEAYEILKQRQINEDRVLAERTSMFLLATSFLFLAFVTLLSSDSKDPIIEILHVALPSVGILLTLFLLVFNIKAAKALGFWHNSEQKIEETAPEFSYMLVNQIAPHYKNIINPKGWLKRTLLSTRTIYWLYLPLVFFALWIISLVFVFR